MSEADSDGRFVYVVLSHRADGHVERLVDAIRRLSPTARIVVSHDVDASPAPSIDGPNVEVRTRRRARWGSWDLVEAELAELRRLCGEPGWDWVALLSGQDYPLRDLAAWERDLARSGRDALVRAWPIAERLRWGASRMGDHNLVRYTHRWFWFENHGPDSRWRRAAREIPRRIARHTAPIAAYQPLPSGGGSVLGIRRRRTPFSEAYPARKGSMWWALSRRAADRVLEVGAERGLEKYYLSTLVPDESFVHTIVRNDPDLRWIDGEVTHALFEPFGAPNPVSITDETLPRLLERAATTHAAFVRKVDPKHPEAVDRLARSLDLPTSSDRARWTSR